jgi:predicted esterase
VSLTGRRCPQHDLALSPDGTCVLCRRARGFGGTRETHANGTKRAWVGATLAALVLAGVLRAAYWHTAAPAAPASAALESSRAPVASAPAFAALESSRAPVASAPAFAALESSRAPVEGSLVIRNVAGRSGAFFLPAGYAGRPLPLAVLLHGTGSSGADILHTFRPAAASRSFIVVAPDSGRAPNGMLTWEVGDHPEEITADFEHVGRCVAEVLAKPGVVIDPAHVIVIGHSGGGSSAPYVATHNDLYESFAVLHGGAFPSGFGPRRPRGWFSTGERDPARPPPGVRAAAEATQRAGLVAVEMHVFDGDHGIGLVELDQLLDWWLGG